MNKWLLVALTLATAACDGGSGVGGPEVPQTTEARLQIASSASVGAIMLRITGPAGAVIHDQSGVVMVRDPGNPYRILIVGNDISSAGVRMTLPAGVVKATYAVTIQEAAGVSNALLPAGTVQATVQ